MFTLPDTSRVSIFQKGRRSSWKNHRLLASSLLLLALPVVGLAQASNTPHAESTIRIWGHGHNGQDYIQTLLTAWQNGFAKTHPGITFEDHLYGNASGLGGVYTGVADLALLDREASFIEVDAFQQATGYNPFFIPVANGSVSVPHHGRALVLYVNRANPLTQLTVQQVDGIFDADHRLGERNYKTWGDLGLSGRWASQPIRLYSSSINSAVVQFFERAALKGSQKFSCSLTVFHDRPGSSAAEQVASAVDKDTYGLGLSLLPGPGLKPLAISSDNSREAVLPTAESIASGTYPLARKVYVYADRKPKTELRPNIAEFLQYIVSPEGQAIVARTGGYLPLSKDVAAKAKESLR